MLSKLELRREGFHLIGGLLLIFLILIDFFTVKKFILLFVIILIACIISKKQKIPFVYWLIKNFDRKIDRKSLPGRGLLFFILGSFIVFCFFDKDIALASIAILTIGDPVSHMGGAYIGKTKNPFNSKKFLEGSIMGMIFAALIAMFFVNIIEAAAAAVIAMTVEGLDIKVLRHDIDDNLIVPIVAALVILAVRIILA